MSTVTLEAIKAEHERLGGLIAQLTSAPPIVETIHFCMPAVDIELNPGEHYAGIVLNANGDVAHHLILLAGEAEEIKFDDACTWAEKAGGALPTRQEQALLYANLKAEFKPEWYWSGESLADDASYAWTQGFLNGRQYDFRKSWQGRARAVRRFKA